MALYYGFNSHFPNDFMKLGAFSYACLHFGYPFSCAMCFFQVPKPQVLLAWDVHLTCEGQEASVARAEGERERAVGEQAREEMGGAHCLVGHVELWFIF